MEVSHNNRVTPLEVRYVLLPFATLIYDQLTFVETQYIGPKAIETLTQVQLEGVDLSVFENSENVRYLENAVKLFLAQVQDQADIASVTVLDASKVEATEDNRFRRFLQAIARSRAHTQDTSSVDLTISITGEYQPPPELDLGKLVTESFQKEGDVFVDTVKTGQNEELKNILSVQARETTAPPPSIVQDKDDLISYELPKEEARKKSNTVPIIIALSGVCFVTLFFVLVWGKNKEVDEYDNDYQRNRSIFSVLMDRVQRNSNENKTPHTYYS